MFKPNTLIVLGAASSLDFGFPLGQKLKGQLASLLDVEFDDWGSPKQRTGAQHKLFRVLLNGADQATTASIYQAADIIKNGVGLTASIDSFLEMRQDSQSVSYVAKAAIFQLIAEHECQSRSLKPFTRRSENQGAPNFDNTWLQQFAQICFTATPKDKIEESLRRVSIVSFNYDRCFAQFLRIAISLLYSIEFHQASELANSLVISHPYGSLGPLTKHSSDSFEFGDDDFQDAAAKSSRIRTYTEGVIEKDVLSLIKLQVSAAERIVFLGFGYHGQNIDILRCDPSLTNIKKQIIGTSIGIADAARKDLELKLRIALQGTGKGAYPDILFEPKDCRQLLEEYRHSLLA